MAKQDGLIKLTGSIGDVSFYKSNEEYLARKKGGADKKTIETSPKFVLVRKNNTEFGMVSTLGRLIRQALRQSRDVIINPDVVNRLNKVLYKIREYDHENEWGSRTAGAGLKIEQGKKELKGFRFNAHCGISNVIHRALVFNKQNNQLQIGEIVPNDVITQLVGATQVVLKVVAINIDMGQRTSVAHTSNEVVLKLNEPQTDVTLTFMPLEPNPGNIHIYVMSLRYYQEINGETYLLNNVTHQVAEIFDVDVI
ncbi:MAG: hypothetical protein IPN86_00510 [Saprospiraceae bacterium]|jgi:hypothetical protein|nr:hypothetical protein [Saprospiraceae bacterium]